MNNTKRITLYLCLSLLLILSSCHSRNELANGDLILVGLPYDYSMTQEEPNTRDYSQGTNYIHVAMLNVEKDGLWVVDATLKHGVDRYPLDTFLHDFTLPDGNYPRFEIFRLKNNREADNYMDNAKTFVGRAYDVDFLLENEAQYCSELVYNSYVSSVGVPLFHQVAMNFKNLDSKYPLYWKELFDFIDHPIPQGKQGTTPESLTHEESLQQMDIDLVEQAKAWGRK